MAKRPSKPKARKPDPIEELRKEVHTLRIALASHRDTTRHLLSELQAKTRRVSLSADSAKYECDDLMEAVEAMRQVYGKPSGGVS